MPDWEDYQNKFGGRWIIERPDPARVEEMDDYWLETLFMMIGEHVDPYNDLINGAVIQSKRGRFRLAIWLKVSLLSLSEVLTTVSRTPGTRRGSPRSGTTSRRSSRSPR